MPLVVEIGEWTQWGGIVVTRREVLKSVMARLEDSSVVTSLKSLTNLVGDGSVVTWGEVLKLLMVRMEMCLSLRCCTL